MNYDLEKISSDDIDRIIKDAQDYKSIRAIVHNAIAEKKFVDTWAFDKFNDSYLLEIPLLVRQEYYALQYIMFFDQVLYRFDMSAAFIHKVKFQQNAAIDKDVLARLKVAMSEAFSIYGLHGNGPLDESGYPEFKVNLQFDERL